MSIVRSVAANKPKVFFPMATLLLLYILFTILSSYFTQSASAWTFEARDWWFSTGASFEVANVAITFTYPDQLEVGEPLEVFVMLEYIDNQMANANYGIFSDVQVHLRNQSDRETIGTINGYDYVDIKEFEPISIRSSDTNSSEVIKKGGQYLTKFSLPTQDLPVGNYSVDLSFTALFSLGNSMTVYPWDTMYYLGEGNLVESDLPPINIVQREQDNTRKLAIAIMKPYGLIHPVNATINGKNYTTDEGRVEVTLPAHAGYEVKVPEEITLVDKEIKAVFKNWADGVITSKRSVTLDKNTELFAIYDTQYWLNVTSSLDNSKLYDNWAGSGEQMEFSVDPIKILTGGIFFLKGFSSWAGDVSATDRSITFIIDSPKDVVQVWAEDSTVLVVFLAVLASIVTIIKEREHIIGVFFPGRKKKQNSSQNT